MSTWRFILPVVAVLSAPVAAHADTTTNAPASYCAGVGATLTVRSDGEIENRTASSITAVCPVERVASATKISGRVFVTDRHSTSNVCCKLVAHTPDGTRQDGTPACSTGNDPAAQTLLLAELALPFSYSHVVVECSVPAMSGTIPSRLQLVRTVQ